MPLTILTFGDPDTGQPLSKLANELAYAMGAELDLSSLPIPTSDLIVLSLICVDPNRGIIPNKTRHRRADKEFRSSFNVDYRTFSQGNPVAKIGAIADALIAAADQVPTTIMPEDTKVAFRRAANRRQYLSPGFS